MIDLFINWYLTQINLGVNKSQAVKKLYLICLELDPNKITKLDIIDIEKIIAEAFNDINLRVSKLESLTEV